MKKEGVRENESDLPRMTSLRRDNARPFERERAMDQQLFGRFLLVWVSLASTHVERHTTNPPFSFAELFGLPVMIYRGRVYSLTVVGSRNTRGLLRWTYYVML